MQCKRGHQAAAVRPSPADPTFSKGIKRGGGIFSAHVRRMIYFSSPLRWWDEDKRWCDAALPLPLLLFFFSIPESSLLLSSWDEDSGEENPPFLHMAKGSLGFNYNFEHKALNGFHIKRKARIRVFLPMILFQKWSGKWVFWWFPNHFLDALSRSAPWPHGVTSEEGVRDCLMLFVPSQEAPLFPLACMAGITSPAAAADTHRVYGEGGGGGMTLYKWIMETAHPFLKKLKNKKITVSLQKYFF